MDPRFTRQTAFARVSAIGIACLILLQVILAGVATAAEGVGEGAGFGVVCGTQQQANPASEPVAPPLRGHAHGLCCILHCGALAEPIKPLPVATVIAFTAVTLPAPPMEAAPSPRAAPKGAPQSPRAPPARG